MYSDKQSVLQLATLLIAHGVRRVVLCPGSRNIPLTQTLASLPELTSYAITDERSAGFFALGLALHDQKPTVVCCTSGTALLNLHPAVAEAFYQHVPLIVVSADRPAAWLGQMDGQTLPQAGVFGELVRYSAQLPEVHSDEDAWHCNRLINEALLAACHHGYGPVHLNLPISEPFFAHPVDQLPRQRTIVRHHGHQFSRTAIDTFRREIQKAPRCMIIAGQMPPTAVWTARVSCERPNLVWIAETLANRGVPTTVHSCIDSLLASIPSAHLGSLRPELLITYGGHIISKRLKRFLRQHRPPEHWHISPDGGIVDLYGSLTQVIETEPLEFLQEIFFGMPEAPASTSDYATRWRTHAARLEQPEFPWSEMRVVSRLINRLPAQSVLHLANSSAVRYAQLFPLAPSIDVLANRGTNGIEGSLSTAIGYAAASNRLNFVLIGDLSFFYDMNALWNDYCGANVRLLVLNNSGGEIFHSLPGLELTSPSRAFITGTHTASARAWAEDRGFAYMSARNNEELEVSLNTFTQPSLTKCPILLEAFTDTDTDITLLETYYRNLTHP